MICPLLSGPVYNDNGYTGLNVEQCWREDCGLYDAGGSMCAIASIPRELRVIKDELDSVPWRTVAAMNLERPRHDK